MDEPSLLKTIARTLYRWEGWQQMPWGVKQVLRGVIADEIAADEKHAEEERARRAAEHEARIQARLRETKVRKLDAPWD